MWKSRRSGWLLAVAAFLAIVVLAVGTHFWSKSRELRAVERANLDLRDGILFVRSENTPFEGLLVEHYPKGAKKIAIEIHGGLAHGMSRGWFESGQLEVEERFVRGLSDGQRTRWYAGGQRRSTASIVGGKLSGLYEEWHPNGRKALQISFRDGKPDGQAMAWSESGEAKPPRTYQQGIASDARQP
jgi:antitoxin component YwqK of YwqJK toxin-antitoxin module